MYSQCLDYTQRGASRHTQGLSCEEGWGLTSREVAVTRPHGVWVSALCHWFGKSSLGRPLTYNCPPDSLSPSPPYDFSPWHTVTRHTIYSLLHWFGCPSPALAAVKGLRRQGLRLFCLLLYLQYRESCLTQIGTQWAKKPRAENDWVRPNMA